MSAPALRLVLPPGIEPRPYQAAAVDAARAAVRQGRRPVIVMPTGAGKTTVGALVASSAVARGSGVLWLAHRRELVAQALERLRAFGLPVGVILAGEQADAAAPVQVASIATLSRRHLPPAQVVIVDECHRGRARTYEEILAQYPGAAVLGLTATPQRGDGRGLAPVFNALVETVTAGELRASGVLVPARVFAPDVPSLAGVGVRAGDFDDAGAALAMSGLTGSIVGHWRKLAASRRTLAFACTVEHSREIRDEFHLAGVPAEHLDGSTPNAERAGMLSRLRTGEIQVLVNVGVCVEGLDIPAVECIVLARPTRSVTLLLQAVGRGLRSSPGKTDCLVLDHAGNALRLGHPEEERAWTLTGKTDQGHVERAVRGAVCPECSRVRAPREAGCPCGFRWPAEAKPALVQRPGSLTELRKRARATPREERVRAYAELVGVAKRRGYSLGWAAHAYRERYGRWPHGLKHLARRIYGGATA